MLSDETKKQAVIEDCMKVLDAEVADKKGLTGLAIKGGFKVVRDFKPGFVRGVVTDLLPEFVATVEPIYEEAKSNGTDIRAHLISQKSKIADGLLAITDGKAEKSKNAIIRKTYQKLRGKAKEHVEASVPRLIGLIETHAG